MQSLPPGVERRRAPRFDVLAQISVHHDDVDLVMLLKNLSVSGALVDMGQAERPPWLTLGRTVDLTLVIPDSDDSADFRATIVRLTEDLSYRHFAIQFLDVDDGARAFLERLVDAGRKKAVPPPLPQSLPGQKKA